MAVIKCKMCGGDLNIVEGATVAECEYCGSKQTIPNQDNEKKLTLFARAERLRRACEFDKAAGVYESIVAEFPEEAEAYWGLVLCRYGIEYVDDPATGKKVPTCHRSSFDSILEDADFDQACENADAIARRLYREEAKAIENIRRGILEVSGKEEPYDIFICYKETDENGGRTIDSVIAQDVYDALTEKGYRVFFSRISLEDKLGSEYEPYIFAALNSAKIMLVFGTDYEYFNAVWVKNEWSRFLALMAAGQKKTLIPCYKNLDAYDMPKEFQRLQAQDMGKVGAIQDLLRGIDKILGRGAAMPTKETMVVQQSSTPVAPGVESLLKRGYAFLEDGEWARADEYFDKVLDIQLECGEAYAGKMCVEMKYHALSNIAQDSETWLGTTGKGNQNYQKILRYGSPDLKNEVEGYITAIKEDIYRSACSAMDEAKYYDAMDKFALIKDYRDADEQSSECARLALSALAERRRKLELMPTNGLFSSGNGHTVGRNLDGTVVATGDNTYGQCDVQNWTGIMAVSAGNKYTVGLRADGTVIAAGNNIYGQCDVQNWIDIVAVSSGSSHTVGLRADGTVVATGDNTYGQCDVQNWTNIVAVSIGGGYTVGLKANGTMVATGKNDEGQCDVQNWTDIVSFSVGIRYTVGLKSDGTVVATGRNEKGQCDVQNWTDIVAVFAERLHTVGLRVDGTVVATGNNTYGQCDVQSWSDIVAVSNGDLNTVGLKSDGTVVATGDNTYGQRDVQNWTDIVAVFSGDFHTTGLKSDGTIAMIGENKNGQCDVQNWKLFNCLDTLERELTDFQKANAERCRLEREEAERRIEAERQQKIAALNSEKQFLQTELANLKGLFSGKRRKEIETRLAEIEAELKKL